MSGKGNNYRSTFHATILAFSRLPSETGLAILMQFLCSNERIPVVYEFCGHGVGIDFHEDPQVEHIARKNTGHYETGMIFTIEPDQ